MITFNSGIKKELAAKRTVVANHLKELSAYRYIENRFSVHLRIKEEKRGRTLPKRLSPFLIAEVCLPVIFIYWLIKGSEYTLNYGLLCILFLFVEINILFIDFALVNFYEGRKMFRVWIIEGAIIFLSALVLKFIVGPQ